MTIAEVLRETAVRHGARPALTDATSGRTLSYADLAAWSERTAAMLVRAGIRPGARVALIAGNALGYIPASFGILATGACVVPAAPTLRPPELQAVLETTDVNAIVTLEGDAPVVAVRDLALPGPPDFHASNAAFVRFTSGTTDVSKGVILSHRDVLERVAAADQVFRLSHADRVLWTLPLAYHFAVTVVAYIRAGAQIILVNELLPADVIDAATAHRATVLYGSPVQFARLAGAARTGCRLADVRLAVSTAAALPNAVAAAFEEAFDVPLGQAYGIIEAGLPCINTRLDGAPATSVGPPVPGYEIMIVGEHGLPLACGAEGEVAIRGRGLFSGYYSPWTPRQAALSAGWLRTGDLGRLDERGRLTLCGRSKAVIVVAGMKVFPEEVESILDGVPGVVESRVVGRPHPHLGEVPCAEIVSAPSGPALDARLLGRACAAVLSSYKVPVEFRFVDTIPKTANGKKLRRPTPFTT